MEEKIRRLKRKKLLHYNGIFYLKDKLGTTQIRLKKIDLLFNFSVFRVTKKVL